MTILQERYMGGAAMWKVLTIGRTERGGKLGSNLLWKRFLNLCMDLNQCDGKQQEQLDAGGTSTTRTRGQ